MNFDIRLVQGPSNMSGRVEVCLGGRWGTICDDEWETVDARTVCKQLGFPYDGAEARIGSYFGRGQDAIHMTNVYCMENDNNIMQCSFHTGTAISSCGHHEDAGVICQHACSNGDIRLSGGMAQNEGRVEVCFNQEWGTICNNHWSTNDGKVVCRQLGYSIESEC